MTISKDVLDELLNGVENAEDLLGDQGLVKELKVRLMERMLGAELTEHLGYEPDAKPANQQSNRRNGTSRKTLKGNDGALPIDVPRDRDGSFEPELIKKGQTRIDGMDDKIIGLYAAGLSTRDIRAHLEEVYGLKVSADLISRVTDAVLEEVSDWQNRALEPMYPIVFLDALRVKIRDAESRQVKNKAVYVALGVTPEGEREVLGLWIAANEGAKFWLSVMNNLRNNPVERTIRPIALKGGDGGYQLADRTSYVAPTAGGPAIGLTGPIIIDNTTGYIGGGGGGGAAATGQPIAILSTAVHSPGGGGAGGGRGGAIGLNNLNAALFSIFADLVRLVVGRILLVLRRHAHILRRTKLGNLATPVQLSLRSVFKSVGRLLALQSVSS